MFVRTFYSRKYSVHSVISTLTEDKDPSSVKFFYGSGVQLSDAGHRNFGFSPVGEDCVEARGFLSIADLTLNFLIGYDSVKYGNIVEGASNSVQFLRFFDEASQTVDPITQRPFLEVGHYNNVAPTLLWWTI